MKTLVLKIMSMIISSTAFAQRHPVPYWSLGGYGNVLFPGTGHAPGAVPDTGAAPRILYSGRDGGKTSEWLSPLFASPPPTPYDEGQSEEYSGSDPTALGEIPFTDSSSPPPVVINPPTFHRSNHRETAMPLRKDPEARAQTNTQRTRHDQATIYLIAFKNHSIVQALGYWMESGTLHYVSAQYTVNQASSALIDWDLSQRLNDERGIPFTPPTK